MIDEPKDATWTLSQLSIATERDAATINERKKKWFYRFADMASFVSTWSKDPSTKVGAVIFDADNRVLGIGYNGFPRGVRDLPERLRDRELKYPRVVHAEVNAVLNSQSTRGAMLACTHFPCQECAKVIIQAGIVCVVVPEGIIPGWEQSSTVAFEMFEEAGVEVFTAIND